MHSGVIRPELVRPTATNVLKVEAPVPTVSKPRQVIIQPQNITLVASEGASPQNKYTILIPKSSPQVQAHPGKTMILNGKEAKTVLLSSNNSQPIVVLKQNGHPNPMQLLPVLSSAVTSVAAAKPNEIKSVAAVTTTTRNGETNNNNKVIYPWHSLVPFLGIIFKKTSPFRHVKSCQKNNGKGL